MVNLGPILPDYKGMLFRWRNNEEIYKWCRQTDTLDWLNHSEWFDNLGKNKTIKMYMILDHDKPVGVCGLTDIDLINQRAEFSLYIAKEFQRTGLGKKALIKLIDHAFKRYPFRIIWGESFDSNPAIKMFKDIGFKIDGIRKEFYFKDGKNIDAHLFSINRNEFYDSNIIDCDCTRTGISSLPNCTCSKRED